MPKRRIAGKLFAIAAVLLVLVGAGLVIAHRLRATQSWEAAAAARLDEVKHDVEKELPSIAPADSAIVDAGRPDARARVQRRQTAPLSSAQAAAPLAHGTFVSDCGAPDTMKVMIKADVKMGRAIDVHATTHPPDPHVEDCVEHAVNGMQWDISPKVAHVTARY